MMIRGNMIFAQSKQAFPPLMLILVLSVALGCISVALMPVAQDLCGATDAGKAYAATPQLSAKSKTVAVGSTFVLKVKNAGKKKVVWRSSNKKVVTVTSKGKVKAKKTGAATIVAKVAGKKLTCKVTVVSKPRKPKIATLTYRSGKDDPYKRQVIARWTKVSEASGYQIAVRWANMNAYRDFNTGQKTMSVDWDSSWSTLAFSRSPHLAYTLPEPVKYGFTGLRMKVRAYKK